MTQSIIPPPELVREWLDTLFDEGGLGIDPHKLSTGLATRAAQWGADCELEACCEWLHEELKLTLLTLDVGLRAARRPKPMSLKKQALQALSEAVKMADDVPPEGICSGQADIIRRALEALPE
jgi:hypothetical protein